MSIAAVVIVIVVMNIVLKKLIKNPVTSLTGNIEKISGGDFTVNISSDGNDEIALDTYVFSTVHGHPFASQNLNTLLILVHVIVCRRQTIT